jgi:DNA polymerase elongation subunit (family B)
LNTHDFLLTVVDTDSVAIVKPDMSPFTEEEQQALINEINSHFPEKIRYAHDGYFERLIVLKAKNYIMYDGKKIKLKGSGIRDQKKEPALREMLDKMIEDLIHNNGQTLRQIYLNTIREALNPQDIKRWAQKKTVTKSITSCKDNAEARRNESVVWDAIKDKQKQEGDKVYIYPAILGSTTESTTYKNGRVKEKIIYQVGLKVVEDYNNDHNVDKLVSRVWDTLQILANVIDMSLFVNYSLTRNKPLLGEL